MSVHAIKGKGLELSNTSHTRDIVHGRPQTCTDHRSEGQGLRLGWLLELVHVDTIEHACYIIVIITLFGQ